MQFVKMHGLGNDFLVIDGRDEPNRDWASLGPQLCDRRFGVGGDGLLILLQGEQHPWRMRIINSDGSEPEMCGNGIRCLAKYLRDSGLETADAFVVETLAGPISPHYLGDDGHGAAQIAVDMGEPRLRPAEIPFLADDPAAERVVAAYLQVDDDPLAVTCVSMGNPHCVIFVDDLSTMNVEWFGAMIERHDRFPARTNVEFVQVHRPDELSMHVWERGAGRTLACGTGACASLVAAVLNDRADRVATVHLEGGDLRIEWRESDNKVIMTGPAVTVFSGRLAAP